jgi:hypothetical protein
MIQKIEGLLFIGYFYSLVENTYNLKIEEPLYILTNSGTRSIIFIEDNKDSLLDEYQKQHAEFFQQLRYQPNSENIYGNFQRTLILLTNEGPQNEDKTTGILIKRKDYAL